FGRIGRMVFRQAINDDQLEVVAINASYPSETLAHLVKYDSVHGSFDGDVKALDDGLEVDVKKVFLFSSREPEKLPTKENNIDILVEATGAIRTKEGAGLHIKAGAKKVLTTAPGKEVDRTIVMGPHEDPYVPERYDVISNASRTTNL